MYSFTSFHVKYESSLEVMTEDVVRNSEIEGLLLNAEHVAAPKKEAVAPIINWLSK